MTFSSPPGPQLMHKNIILQADKSDPFANAPDDKSDEAKDSTESERDRDESSNNNNNNNTPLNDSKDANEQQQQDAQAGEYTTSLLLHFF